MTKLVNSGIYRIYNIANGKFYIGSAVNFASRWHLHLYNLDKGTHRNRHLQSAWNSYGKECFIFEILERVSRENLLAVEQAYLDKTRCCDREIGYNLYSAAGSPFGSNRSEESKEKQRLVMTGFKHSADSIAKMRIVQSNRSDETKAKLSKSKIGHVVSEETRRKIGAANKLSNLGRVLSKETRLKIGAANKGKAAKLELWPHGCKCKCAMCKDIRNELALKRRYAKRKAA